MIYRPQFAYKPAPPGWQDEQFHYSFSGANVPALLGNSPVSLGMISDIVLPLQADAKFMARAFKMQQAVQTISDANNPFAFQLKTPRGDYLQTVPVPMSLYCTQPIGINAVAYSGASLGAAIFIPFEDEIECPAGSSWTLYLYNFLGNSPFPSLTLYGVKRRRKVAA